MLKRPHTHQHHETPEHSGANAPDVLSQVLKLVRAEGEVYCRSELGSGAGLVFPPGKAHFHLVERGVCWLHLAGETAPHKGEAGDLLVLPHGHGHTLTLSSSDRRGKGIEAAVSEGYDPARHLLRIGDGDPVVQLVCGRFTFEEATVDTLVRVLPTVLHLHGHDHRPLERIELLLRFLGDEVGRDTPGSAYAASRLLELLFVESVRHWLADRPVGVGGWLGALCDPAVGRGLGRIHGDPTRPWTVGTLARSVGMSRSPFAARFAALVGEPPMAYLTRWRMQLAAGLLRQGLSVKEAAARVGYSSEAAFSRAYKRCRGASPVKHRGRPAT